MHKLDEKLRDPRSLDTSRGTDNYNCVHQVLEHSERQNHIAYLGRDHFVLE